MSANVANVVDRSSISFTGNLTPTTLYSASVDTLIRVSIFEERYSSSASARFTWVDSSGTQVFSPSFLGPDSGTVRFFSFPLLLKAGESLEMDTYGAGPSDSTTFTYAIESLS